jgi:type IV secretory pathway TraG/TraD family ATPase VirD4
VSSNSKAGSDGGAVVSILLGVVGCFGGGGTLFWLAGQLSAVLSGHGWPDSSLRHDLVPILQTWKESPGDPARAWPAAAANLIGPAWLVYTIFVVLLVPLAFLGYVLIRFYLNYRRRRGLRIMRLGFASGWEIRRLLGAKAVVKRAQLASPRLSRLGQVQPNEVGFLIGRDYRSQAKLYSSIEDTMLIVAPPRQGKDAHFCIPFTLDAPGACVVATTGIEAFTATVEARGRIGKVYVFDPNRLTHWPSRWHWSPITMCEDPDTADDHAKLFVYASDYTPGADGSFSVASVAIVIIRCYLHAAALHGKSIRDVIRWSTDPTDPEPVELLRRAEAAHVAGLGWADELAAAVATDAETRGARWAVVRQSMSVFFDAGVQEECTPRPGEVFDLKEFVSGPNTLYILAKERGTNPVAPLVTLILQDMLGDMRSLALKSTGGRLDPPVSVEINEAGLTASTMVSLPRFMGLMGRYSVAVHVYLRSMSQAQDKWGKDGAATMWDNAAVRVIAGGGGNIDDLEEVSKLLGDIQLPSGESLGRRVLTATEIRTMPFGRAVVVAGDARPVEVVLTPWWKRKDSKEIATAKARAEALIGHYLDKAGQDSRVQDYMRSSTS